MTVTDATAMVVARNIVFRFDSSVLYHSLKHLVVRDL